MHTSQFIYSFCFVLFFNIKHLCVLVWLADTCCCYFLKYFFLLMIVTVQVGGTTHMPTLTACWRVIMCSSTCRLRSSTAFPTTTRSSTPPSRTSLSVACAQTLILTGIQKENENWDWCGNKFICYSDNNDYYIAITMMMIIQSKRLLFHLPISPLPSLKWYVYNIIICCVCQ